MSLRLFDSIIFIEPRNDTFNDFSKDHGMSCQPRCDVCISVLLSVQWHLFFMRFRMSLFSFNCNGRL